MGTPRAGATAVTLQDGRVLVVGGSQLYGSPSALNTGEVYKLVGNSWTPVLGTMSSERTQFPAAVLLPSGKVLIAGGSDSAGDAVTTADLYDPGTNSFSPTGSMGTARSYAAATLLSNGKVLVVGGADASGAATGTGDVYDPATGHWTATANAMTDLRVVESANALPNGKVLIAGGQSTGGPSTTASTDLYDPATNRFSPGPAMNAGRAAFGSTAANGGVFAVGGFVFSAGNSAVDGKAQFYNPAANAWVSLAPMVIPKQQVPLVQLGDGDLLAAGGSNDGGGPTTDVQLFTPPTVPGTPGTASATPSNGSATVVFAPPASNGGLPVLRYTVTASTGQSATVSDGRTTATVRGLTNGKKVTFTVTATNGMGSGSASAASAAVMPTAPPAPPVTPPAPKLKLTSLKTKLKLANFLKGVTFTAAPDRSASLRVSLLASVNRATISRAYQLVLATKSLGASTKKRTLTIVPSKKLVGRPRKATVQLVIVATGSTGRQTTITKQLTVTR